MAKYNDIKRVRNIKTLVRDTRQKFSVNGSVTLATIKCYILTIYLYYRWFFGKPEIPLNAQFVDL